MTKTFHSAAEATQKLSWRRLSRVYFTNQQNSLKSPLLIEFTINQIVYRSPISEPPALKSPFGPNAKARTAEPDESRECERGRGAEMVEEAHPVRIHVCSTYTFGWGVLRQRIDRRPPRQHGNQPTNPRSISPADKAHPG